MMCASCSAEHEKNDTEPDCEACKHARLMPENQQAWAFFQEILFWSGGGFIKKGILDVGNMAGGLDFILKLRTYLFSDIEIDELYWKLKIIYAAVNEVNSDKMEQLEKSGD